MPTIQDAAMVLNQYYDLRKPKIEWIQNAPSKSVWKVIDNKESYVLKTDYRSNKAFAPSISLQNALFKQGLKIPEVIPTNQRKLCTRQGKHRYYLSRYISGSNVSISDRARAIGDFHQQARWPKSLPSNQSPADWTTGINTWISDYELKLKDLVKWGDQHSIRKHIQPCIQLAEKCLSVSSRKTSPLADHLKTVYKRRWLAHGDLNHENAIKTATGEIWIIDLELTRVDSPIKDIRFLLPKMMLTSQYKEYFARFVDGKPFEELYYIDAIFPHGLHFYIGGMIRKKKLPLNVSLIKDFVLEELKKDEMISRQLGSVK